MSNFSSSTMRAGQRGSWEIVLLGETGSGKSATGNTIIGGDRDTFKEEFSAVSVTRICKSAHTEVNGQEINVIDTIGLSDTLRNGPDEFKRKIEQIFDCAHEDGIDVFLLVFKLGDTFTQEKQNSVKWIQDNFGAKASKHTIVLFTHGDLLSVSIQEYLTKNKLLETVVDQCSGEYYVFNNKNVDRSQVTELLRKVRKLSANNQSRYTKDDYTEIQNSIRAEGGKREEAGGGEQGGIIGGATAGAAAAIFAVKIGAIGAAVLGAAVGIAAGATLMYLLRNHKSNNTKNKNE